jgi:SAM-dependent methyltransferase
VTGVDISATALERAAGHAQDAGVSARTQFERRDLSETFPAGQFDLICALYLHSPVAFPRDQVLRTAAAAVAPGGLLLVVEHASVAPWSCAAQGTVFAPPEQLRDALELRADQWQAVFVGAPERQLAGPGSQVATVKDNVLVFRRLTV